MAYLRHLLLVSLLMAGVVCNCIGQVNFSIDTVYAHPYFYLDIVSTSTIYNTSEDTVYIHKKMLEDITCLTDTNAMRTYDPNLKASYILLKDFKEIEEIMSPPLPPMPSDDTLLSARDFETSVLSANDKLQTVVRAGETYFLVPPYANVVVNSIISLDLSFYRLLRDMSLEQSRKASVDLVLHTKSYTNADPLIRDLFSIPPSSDMLKTVFLRKLRNQ